MTTRYGFVSTYPPTLCGLATFTAALRAELPRADEPDVIRLLDATDRDERPFGLGGSGLSADVLGNMTPGDDAGIRRAAHLLNQRDLVVLQHEFGVFGGPDGDEAVSLMDLLSVPTIVVLHTVLGAPTPHQRSVLGQVAARAAALVTMSEAAYSRLAGNYDIDMGKVHVIPHGAPAPHAMTSPVFRSPEPLLLTWGLIGPGKGIEWGIDAMVPLRESMPALTYVVAGQTHPKVQARDGEAYRQALAARIRRLGLADRVSLDGRYLHAAALEALVASADAVLLPYDSTDQVTSGVLVEAVAAGVPVVATRFPHAVELLRSGDAGVLVPHRDPAAMAQGVASVMGRAWRPRETPSDLLWPAVAGRYDELAARLLRVAVPA